MYRDTLQRCADMAAKELPAAPQLLGRTVKIDMRIRHLAPALGGKDQHRADAAVHVDLVIGQRCACVIAQIIKRLLALHQVKRDGLEHPRTIMERHLAQRRPAGVAGVGQHRLHIQCVVSGMGDHIAGDRAGDGAGAGPRCDPLSGGVTGNVEHIGSLMCVVVDDEFVRQRIGLAGQHIAALHLIILKRVVEIISTSPSSTLPMQVEQTPALQENGAS